MFTARDLETELQGVRAAHAPDTLVLDVERDFETLDPAVAETLGLFVDELAPASYPAAWVPADAPELLHRLASDEFTIGAPGDGGVAWTRQTTPPTVFVKPRLQGSPPEFVDFLVAEALVQVGIGIPGGDALSEPGALPEQFLPFFADRYRELADVTPLSPADTYQLAYALFEAYTGLHTRDVFADWAGDHPDLHAQWVDAGERLEPRLADLAQEVATGKTGFAAAAEYACSAIKHALDVPAPFAALDTDAYRHHGPEYAVRWAEKTFEKLDD
jgi:hypothetical protein